MPGEYPKKGEPILFMDVESLPAKKDNPLWLELSAQVEPLAGESEAEKLVRIEKLRLRTSLHAPLGRVWMIGWADRMRDPVLHVCDGEPESEKALLEEFYASIEGFKNLWWVGHNIEAFDIPFLQVRALHHDLPFLARKMGRLRSKPWEGRSIDTHKMWPRTSADRFSWAEGPRGMGRLDTLCSVLGIKRQDGVMGSEVYQAFLDGNQQGVEEHLEYDIHQVREVFRRLWPAL